MIKKENPVSQEVVRHLIGGMISSMCAVREINPEQYNQDVAPKIWEDYFFRLAYFVALASGDSLKAVVPALGKLIVIQSKPQELFTPDLLHAYREMADDISSPFVFGAHLPQVKKPDQFSYETYCKGAYASSDVAKGINLAFDNLEKMTSNRVLLGDDLYLANRICHSSAYDFCKHHPLNNVITVDKIRVDRSHYFFSHQLKY